MILFNKAQANEIIVTLKEKQTLTNPYFLFILTCLQSGKVSSCIAPDTSMFTDRYNKFSITETDTPDPISAEVTLNDTGQYTYEVYEQNSSTNLNPNGLNLLENGEMKVLANVTSTPEFNAADNPIIVFEG